MNVTTDGETPPFTAIPKPQGSHDYLFAIGFFFTSLLLFTITYVSYICKRQSPPPPDTNEDSDNHHLIRLSRGLDDDVLITFPTFVYSETKLPHKVNSGTVDGSGCSICLVDYIPVDVVRILPECSHVFHVGCIDTWLKVHPTCPVCRNSPLAVPNLTDLTQ